MGQLGDTLRERRVSLGISIETAETDTKIRGRLLEAIESGDYDRLPNPGYVRGYVSSYARYLELDPIPLLAMYRAETGAGRFHDVNLPEDNPVSRRHEQHAVPWRVSIISAVLVVVLAVAGWVAYRAYHGPSAPPPIPSTSTTESSTPQGQTQTSAPPFTLKVSVSANAASTLKATIDGSTAYNGTLAGGQTQTFQVTQSAVLKIGKPSVVSVTRDGKKVALPKTSSATITLKTQP